MTTARQQAMAVRPTVEDPYEFQAVAGGHGYLYVDDHGMWIFEHCVDGRWHGCDLGEHDGLRSANHQAMAHVRATRRRVHGDTPVRLGNHFRHAGPTEGA